MAKDYRLVKKTARGEIVFDEGMYTYVPKDFTPYKYKTSKSLRNLMKKL
jgi:hypothetical protein